MIQSEPLPSRLPGTQFPIPDENTSKISRMIWGKTVLLKSNGATFVLQLPPKRQQNKKLRHRLELYGIMSLNCLLINLCLSSTCPAHPLQQSFERGKDYRLTPELIAALRGRNVYAFRLSWAQYILLFFCRKLPHLNPVNLPPDYSFRLIRILDRKRQRW